MEVLQNIRSEKLVLIPDKLLHMGAIFLIEF